MPIHWPELWDDLFRLYRPDLLILDGDILLYIEAINPALQKKLQANSASPLEISTPFLGKLACSLWQPAVYALKKHWNRSRSKGGRIVYDFARYSAEFHRIA